MRITRLLLTLLAALALASAQPGPKKAIDAKKADAKQAATEAKSGALIDVNTATADQLKTIPGIGDARADAIIKNRPYARKDEIVSKAGVPQGVYDKIKDQIIAKHPPAAKKKK